MAVPSCRVARSSLQPWPVCNPRASLVRFSGVGGHAPRRSTCAVAVQSDHLAADQHPVGRLQMLGKLCQVRPLPQIRQR